MGARRPIRVSVSLAVPLMAVPRPGLSRGGPRALEADILSALGQIGLAETARVRLVLASRGRLVPYTTVASALQRLYRRGLLVRSTARARGGDRYRFELMASAAADRPTHEPQSALDR